MTSSHANRPCADRRPLFWVGRRGALIALIALHAAAIVAVAIEGVFPIDADGHGAERVDALNFIASYALYGFVGCVVLVLLGHVLRWLVMRSENYYETGER